MTAFTDSLSDSCDFEKRHHSLDACARITLLSARSVLLSASMWTLLKGLQQERGIIVRSQFHRRPDNGAALLLQARDCWYSLDSQAGSKRIVSAHHHARPRPTWVIPTLHSLSTVQIFELPSTASWRP